MIGPQDAEHRLHSRYWRARAADLRVVAGGLVTDLARLALLRQAASCDRFADDADGRCGGR